MRKRAPEPDFDAKTPKPQNPKTPRATLIIKGGCIILAKMYDRNERNEINQKLKQETKDLIFSQQVEKLIEERKQQKLADAEGARTYAE